MFVSPTVNLRPDPSTLYAHAQEYVKTLDELGRFRNFFLQRIPELEEVAKAQKVLGASREARRTWEIETPYSEKERRLLREAEGKDRLLLLDEWVSRSSDGDFPSAGVSQNLGSAVYPRRVGRPCRVEPVRPFESGEVPGGREWVFGWCDCQAQRSCYTRSSCRVCLLHVPCGEFSQMMLARIVEVLEIFRKCVLDLYVAFKDAWEILQPSVRYHPVGELVEDPCAFCAVPLTAGSSCVPVNGARGSQGIICFVLHPLFLGGFDYFALTVMNMRGMSPSLT